jgi:WD40 repeat protein
MDVRVEKNNVIIASGSKDKSIVLSSIERFGHAYWSSTFHSAKVGCVSLPSVGNSQFIVSASDDGLVAVHDARMDGLASTAAVTIEDAHFKPHSAVWRPGSDSIFLTAGLDEQIKLWDTRNATRPLASFHGHVPQSGKKMKRIHRPTFMTLSGTADSFILSGGEGSNSLSMFQLGNIPGAGSLHSVFNRGKLPEDHGDVGSLAVLNDTVAVAGEGGEVLILSPRA